MADSVLEYFQNKAYNSNPEQSLMGSIGAGLGSLVLGNKVADGAAQNRAGIQQQIDSLSGMYGPNSPYATQLRQALARKDAAAGRNSQYGPREVELQARLAGLQGQNAATIGNLMNQQQKSTMDEATVRAQQLSHLFNIADKSGATGWAQGQLRDLFNPSAVNQSMDQSPYAGGGDYTGYTPGSSDNFQGNPASVPMDQSPYANYGGNYQDYTTGAMDTTPYNTGPTAGQDLSEYWQ